LRIYRHQQQESGLSLPEEVMTDMAAKKKAPAKKAKKTTKKK